MQIPPAFFSTALVWSSIKWLLFIAIFIIFASVNWRENRKIKRQLQSLEPKDMAPLLTTLLHRDKRLWLLFFLLVAVVAANDIRHDMALLPDDFFRSPVPVAAKPSALPEARESSADEKYDSVLRKNVNSSLPFSAITEFNEQNSKQEAYIDWLKERYEAWLITFYYLQKCQKTGPDDYDIIHRSLLRDLASAHADGAVEGNILMAASGSYKEMYSDVPCDAAHLAQTKSAYDANMQQIKPPASKALP